jgi:phi13 family phage major tail protein
MAKGVQIGVSNFVYALLLDDPTEGLATYGAPVRIPGLISANVNPNSANATLFAENGPYETASTIGEIGLEVNVADLSLEQQAELFGHAMENGVLIRKSGDVPPWLAVGYKSLKSNGHYRYTWLLKGKFALPEQANETKGDSINFQTPTASASFVKRECDDQWQRQIDEDSLDYAPSQGTAWFNDPYGVSSVDTVAPSVTVAPAAGATAVAVTASVIWTFDKEILNSTATVENFSVIKTSDGSVVPGTLTISGSKKVVTFKSTANLAAASQYTAIVTANVKGLNGVKLTAPKVASFTTA